MSHMVAEMQHSKEWQGIIESPNADENLLAVQMLSMLFKYNQELWDKGDPAFEGRWPSLKPVTETQAVQGLHVGESFVEAKGWRAMKAR